MFKENEKTVLILGAGASIPYGYPTGEDLLKKIQRFLNQLTHNIRQNDNITSNEKEFLQLINDIAPLNIDYFLRNNPKFKELGKTLIAHCLLKCATKNSFTDNNWYRYLYHAVVSGCSNLSDVKRSLQNLQIITFNYDLSLEYYLIDRINKTELFKDENSPLRPEDLNIYHVYGQLYPYNIDYPYNIIGINDITGDMFLGLYDFYSKNCKNVESLFGIETNVKRFGAAQDIETMSDPISNQKPCLIEKREKIQEIIKQTKNLYVLGYGFDVNNNDIIGLKYFFDTNRGDKKTFHYTNFSNSDRITRLIKKFEALNKNDIIEIIESRGKSVAKALLDDFDLSPNFD